MSKKLFGLSAALFCLTTSAFALDNVVKEETTPPTAEGAITLEQIPPIDNKKQKSIASEQETPSSANTASVNSPTIDSTMVKPPETK